MSGVSKIIPPNKTILKNIYLSFFYGAKIGVLGLNGSGKSTLLKLIAGIDQNYQGKIVFDKDYKIGYLAQEPELDESKNVKECIEEGVGEVMDLLKAYEEINLKFSEPMSDDEMNKLIEKQGELTDQLEKVDAWNIDNKIAIAMDALKCPPADAKVSVLSGGEKTQGSIGKALIN